jgi:hypothetical protein
MRRLSTFAAAAATLATIALAACSDSIVQPTGSQRAAPAGGANLVITPVLSDAIVTTTGGSFANAIVPTEAGRGTGAFWDNVSSDDHDPPTVKCNIGYFAIGTISPLCNFTAPGSTPGGYANYFGNGAGNTGSPDFMFAGKYSYDVKIVGAYSFGTSTVGWFTKSGGVYTLNAVPQWGAKNIGVAITVNTGGLDWGFFASNANFTGQRTCGGTTDNTCSDATGGFTTQPLQQHALFINSTGDQFLVGLEDNLLGLWNGDCPSALHPGCSPPNPTNQDSDYQDYIFNIVPHVIAPPLCDFITFGRLVTQVGGDKIVISGNAGGNKPGGGILGTIEISVGGVQYHVPTVETYALPTSGVLFGDPFARVITGHSGTHLVELRLRDNPNPGQGEPTDEGDQVWLKIDNTVIVPLQTPDKGNIQLHLHCRGPGE